MESENTSQKKNKSLLFIVLAAIFGVALIVILIIFINTNGKLKKLVEEKDVQRIEIQAELDSLLVQHNQVKSDYGAIADSLLSKDSLIQANAKEIKRLLNTQWEYVKVKRKLKKLQEISQVYVVQLDSLYTVNEELKQENKEITQKYQTERKKNTELIKTTDELSKKVSDAAILKAYSIDITAINVRGSREKETDKAHRAHKLDVCFTLSENLVMEPGMKKIYIRIAGPDTKILTRGEGEEYSFEFQGDVLQYSVMQEIDYQNQAMDVCITWLQLPEDPELLEGQYIVNIFTEESEIGQKSITLK